MVKQSLQHSLQQKLSPQQIQLMKLIELSTLELEQKVKDEIETNPALDDQNPEIDFNDNNVDDDNFESEDSNQDFDITEYISDDDIPPSRITKRLISREGIGSVQIKTYYQAFPT